MPRVPATARESRPRGETSRMASASPGASRSSTIRVPSGREVPRAEAGAAGGDHQRRRTPRPSRPGPPPRSPGRRPRRGSRSPGSPRPAAGRPGRRPPVLTGAGRHAVGDGEHLGQQVGRIVIRHGVETRQPSGRASQPQQEHAVGGPARQHRGAGAGAAHPDRGAERRSGRQHRGQLGMVLGRARHRCRGLGRGQGADGVDEVPPGPDEARRRRRAARAAGGRGASTSPARSATGRRAGDAATPAPSRVRRPGRDRTTPAANGGRRAVGRDAPRRAAEAAARPALSADQPGPRGPEVGGDDARRRCRRAAWPCRPARRTGRARRSPGLGARPRRPPTATPGPGGSRRRARPRRPARSWPRAPTRGLATRDRR